MGGADRGAGRSPARRPRPAARRSAQGGRAGLHQRAAGRGAGHWFEQALAYATAKLHGARTTWPPGRAAWAAATLRGGLPCSSTPPGTPPGPGARQHLGRPASATSATPADAAPPGRQRPSAGCSTATPSRAPAPPTPATGRPPHVLAVQQPRGRGPAARPGQRQRCRRAAGRAAVRRRRRCRCGPRPTPTTGHPPGLGAQYPSGGRGGPGRAAGPGQRQRRGRRRAAGLLAERGDLDQAEQLLRAGPNAGDGVRTMRLAGLLDDRGDLDQLRAGPTATGMPPGGWPICWPSTGVWTSCGARPPPGRWTTAGPGPAARPGQRRRRRTMGWPVWPTAGTWTSAVHGFRSTSTGGEGAIRTRGTFTITWEELREASTRSLEALRSSALRGQTIALMLSNRRSFTSAIRGGDARRHARHVHG